MFSTRIVKNFTTPTHSGFIDPADIILENKDPVCGDQIRISMEVRNGRVQRARFRAWGCATSLATANIICTWMEGKSLERCASASPDELADVLGELSPEQRHCHAIAVNLLKQVLLGVVS